MNTMEEAMEEEPKHADDSNDSEAQQSQIIDTCPESPHEPLLNGNYVMVDGKGVVADDSQHVEQKALSEGPSKRKEEGDENTARSKRRKSYDAAISSGQDSGHDSSCQDPDVSSENQSEKLMRALDVSQLQSSDAASKNDDKDVSIDQEDGRKNDSSIKGQVSKESDENAADKENNVPGQSPTSNVPGQSPTNNVPGQSPTSNVPSSSPTNNVPGQSPPSVFNVKTFYGKKAVEKTEVTLQSQGRGKVKALAQQFGSSAQLHPPTGTVLTTPIQESTVGTNDIQTPTVDDGNSQSTTDKNVDPLLDPPEESDLSKPLQKLDVSDTSDTGRKSPEVTVVDEIKRTSSHDPSVPVCIL